MNCFGGRVSQDLFQNCCNANTLCEFNGDLDCVTCEPIYVQKVFDAVSFNLQGMKTINNQIFSPCIPAGSRVKRVIDIRTRKSFNPCNVDDPSNLKLDVNTMISGASFLQNANGEYLKVVGADGSFSEKLLYAESQECDSQCKGTPIFGTQHINISGNVIVELDLLICDSCNHEHIFTVCADVNIADSNQPLVLTNFFEICMPSSIDTAFLPRFTELSNSACEARLATNSCGRDLSVNNNGNITGNLIIAICVTCEKKIVVPVQICVLSTGYVQPTLQQNPICTTFPSLYPSSVRPQDTAENCCNSAPIHGDGCGCDDGYINLGGTTCGFSDSCNTGCNEGYDSCNTDCSDTCDDGCSDGRYNRPARPRPQPRR